MKRALMSMEKSMLNWIRACGTGCGNISGLDCSSVSMATHRIPFSWLSRRCAQMLAKGLAWPKESLLGWPRMHTDVGSGACACNIRVRSGTCTDCSLQASGHTHTHTHTHTHLRVKTFWNLCDACSAGRLFDGDRGGRRVRPWRSAVEEWPALRHDSFATVARVRSLDPVCNVCTFWSLCQPLV
jgi:hypothetical protein